MAELPFGPAAVAPPPPQPPPPPGAMAPHDAGSTQAGPATLQEIVQIAHQNKYSDIHIGVGEQPRFRDRGDMHRTDWPVTDTTRFRDWVREMLTPVEIDSFLRDKEYDGAYDFGFVRVRINLLDTLRGPAMVLRLIPQKILTMEELDLPPVLAELPATCRIAQMSRARTIRPRMPDSSNIIAPARNEAAPDWTRRLTQRR